MMKFISFFLMAGFAVFVIYMGKSAQKKAKARSKTQKEDEQDSMVRVRQTGQQTVREHYDPTEELSGIMPEPMDFGADELSETEITPLEEFLDEATPIERKREIAGELRECGCHLFIKGDFKPKFRPVYGDDIGEIVPKKKAARFPRIPEDGADEQLDGPDSYN